MTDAWIPTLLSVFLVSLISLVGVATISVREAVLRRFVFLLVALSVGALFGDVFLHMLPEAFESASPAAVSVSALGGIMIFFILEKFLHWRHAHDAHQCAGPACHEALPKPLGRLIVVSDGAHNFIDGVILAAGYLVSLPVGIATTVAVILHEIPQEIGDFGVLLHSGYTRARALVLNFFSALTAFAGAILSLALASQVSAIQPILLSIAAGGFIYIAGADLVPELHKTTSVRASVAQFVTVGIGVAAMALLLMLE